MPSVRYKLTMVSVGSGIALAEGVLGFLTSLDISLDIFDRPYKSVADKLLARETKVCQFESTQCIPRNRRYSLLKPAWFEINIIYGSARTFTDDPSPEKFPHIRTVATTTNSKAESINLVNHWARNEHKVIIIIMKKKKTKQKTRPPCQCLLKINLWGWQRECFEGLPATRRDQTGTIANRRFQRIFFFPRLVVDHPWKRKF